MIQLLPTFHGLENENPYLHIREFKEVVATFHSHNATDDIVRLKFFPFSLKDRANSWLYSLRPRSIGSWNEMTQVFFNKYFSQHKTNALKRPQKHSETLYQACERFLALSYFYEGFTSRERQFIEMMCNGEFLQKNLDEAIEYLNEFARKAHTWTGPSATESTNRSQPAGNPNSGGIYHLRDEDNLKAKVEMLTRELEVLRTKDLKPTDMATHVESFGPCFVCGGVDSLAQECLTFVEMTGIYEEQCNALDICKKPCAPFSDTYNPWWRNHPNFS
ncbi:hypothetical protein F2P56_015405 [Juglans regia]|uniref:Retrotransposon gag domain-containing protein n=2 Tax=Juglans regia TaxID=51240 RepID=A0A833XES3_JUGRE|nr:uncharacterized protein LOC109005460 [Juglans regia]KAF5465392.1 hypothetical protein F2P56_015405 [Juglans regia]